MLRENLENSVVYVKICISEKKYVQTWTFHLDVKALPIILLRALWVVRLGETI